MASYLPEFLALMAVHFLAVSAPGPDFAIMVSQSVRHGRAIGVVTALGIGSGIALHVTYTLLGVGALLHASHQLTQAVRFVGAGYLIYLGFHLLRAKPSDASDEGDSTTNLRPSFKKAFFTGFLTNATNPKATLFFLAIFTTLVSEKTPLSVQVLYGLWMCVSTAIWFALVARLFSQTKVRAQFLRFGHWFERAMGLLLIVFAALALFLGT